MVGQQLLVPVLQEGERSPHYLHVSMLLAALVLHHPGQCAIPFGGLSHLLLGVTEAREITVTQALHIESAGAHHILHLVHVGQIGRYILLSEFFCYKHRFTLRLLYIY